MKQSVFRVSRSVFRVSRSMLKVTEGRHRSNLTLSVSVIFQKWVN